MIRLLVAVCCDEAGTALAEYGLVLMALAVVAISGFFLLQRGGGTTLDGTANGWQKMALSPP